MPEKKVLETSETPVKKLEFGFAGIILGIAFIAVILLVLNYFNLINLPFNSPKQAVKITNNPTTDSSKTKELVEIDANIKPEILKQLDQGIGESKITSAKHIIAKDQTTDKTIGFYIVKAQTASGEARFIARDSSPKNMVKELRFEFFPTQKPGDVRVHAFPSEQAYVLGDGLMDFRVQVENTKIVSGTDNIDIYQKEVLPVLRKVLGNDYDTEQQRLNFSNQVTEFLKTSYSLNIYDENRNKIIEFIRNRSQNENEAIDKIIDNL
jgi:hypothetical protein